MDKKKPSFSGHANPKLSKQTGTKVKSRNLLSHLTLFEQINKWLDRYLTVIFGVTFVVTLLVGILLFDIRFSFMGDDSAYVIRAFDFIHHFILPGFQGPLYPIVLSPLVALFGISAIPLKSLSILFMLGFFYFFYKAFKNRIPTLLLTALLILICINSYLLYYASQTFSEAFFMFLEALAFCVFFSFFIDDKANQSFSILVRRHLIFALCVLCLVITRSIGISCVLAVSAYFILQRQWRNLLYFILAFMFIMTLFQGFKYLLWGDAGFHFNEQGDRLMYKDFYTPALGREDFHGFVQRLIGNSVFFLSGSFYTFLGVYKEEGISNLSMSLTVLTYLILLTSVVLAYRKNKYLLFTGIYLLFFLVNTCIILQSSWQQSRLIIPYFPLIAVMFFAFFYYLSGFKQLRFLSAFFVVLVLILFALTLKTTIVHVSYTRQINNRYFGLTPDWENYCKASEWASKNLSKDAVIACRKPTISFIYGNGRRFYGIGEVKTYSGSSILEYWQKNRSQLYLLTSYSMRKEMPENLFYDLRNGIVAFGTKVDFATAREYFQFYILRFPDTRKDKILADLAKYHLNPTNNIDSLEVFLNKDKESIRIIYPDTLLNILMKANVTHVLEAHLRRTASKKNGMLVNTVERFMLYTGIKYPQLLSKVVQIGSDDNEPAVIYKVNYEKYGLKIPK